MSFISLLQSIQNNETNYILLYVYSLALICFVHSQNLRSSCLANSLRYDWPRTKIRSTADKKQKQELITILDQLQEAHINTILFWVRTRGRFFTVKYKP